MLTRTDAWSKSLKLSVINAFSSLKTCLHRSIHDSTYWECDILVEIFSLCDEIVCEKCIDRVIIMKTKAKLKSTHDCHSTS